MWRKISRVLVVLVLVLCLLPAVVIPALASGQEKSMSIAGNTVIWNYTYWQNQYAPYMYYQNYNISSLHAPLNTPLWRAREPLVGSVPRVGLLMNIPACGVMEGYRRKKDLAGVARAQPGAADDRSRLPCPRAPLEASTPRLRR